MSNRSKRLIMFAVAIPALILLISAHWANYLGTNLLISLLAVGGAVEMARLLRRCGYPVNSIVAAGLGGGAVVIQYLHSFNLFRELPVLGGLTRSWLLTATVALAFTLPVFAPSKYSMRARLQIAIGYTIVFIYPGFLMSYWVELTQQTNSVFWMLLFMLGVQLNDSIAWVVGVFFGRIRNVIAVSPNKSITGFIGGIFATVALFFLARMLFPHYFNPNLSWPWLLLLSVALALLAIIGDLVESMLKRAAEVKDSGKIVLGRGGVLDSTDSLLLTAPLYVYLLPLFAA